MSNDSLEIGILSWLKRGRQRRLVYEQVTLESQTVSEIMNKVNKFIRDDKNGKEIRLRDISRALKHLEEKKLVKCLNHAEKPGDKGILYLKV